MFYYIFEHTINVTVMIKLLYRATSRRRVALWNLMMIVTSKQLKTALNLGRLCQIILKWDKEMSGDGQLAQDAIFAYHMLRQTPFIAIPLLRFPDQYGCCLSWMRADTAVACSN